MPTPALPDGPKGTGSDELAVEKRERLLRLSRAVWHDAMSREDLSYEVRFWGLVTAERFRLEAEAI